MLQIINSVGDRLLGLVAPRVTASAADCGYIVQRIKCYRGIEWVCKCFDNSNCACISCTPTTHLC